MKPLRYLLTAALLLTMLVAASAQITFRRAPQYSRDTVHSNRYYLVCITDPGNLAAIGGEQVPGNGSRDEGSPSVLRPGHGNCHPV